MQNEICPVCGNDGLELGERVDVGFGGGEYGQKVGPDCCHNCGYVEAGADPTDLPFEHYEKCWELQVSPHISTVESKKRGISPIYGRWIKENVAGAGYGKCFEMSRLMRKAFPELRLVRGHYYCVVWGARSHFWLIDPEGYIVDPTAAQFPTEGKGLYDGTLLTEDQIFQLVGTGKSIL